MPLGVISFVCEDSMRCFVIFVLALGCAVSAIGQTPSEAAGGIFDGFLSNAIALESGDVLFETTDTFESAPKSKGKPQNFLLTERITYHRFIFDYPANRLLYLASTDNSVSAEGVDKEVTSQELCGFVCDGKTKTVRIIPNQTVDYSARETASLFKMCDAPEIRSVGIFAFGSGGYGLEAAKQTTTQINSGASLCEYKRLNSDTTLSLIHI